MSLEEDVARLKEEWDGLTGEVLRCAKQDWLRLTSWYRRRNLKRAEREIARLKRRVRTLEEKLS